MFLDIPFIPHLEKHLNVQESEAKWNPHISSMKSVKGKIVMLTAIIHVVRAIDR